MEMNRVTLTNAAGNEVTVGKRAHQIAQYVFDNPDKTYAQIGKDLGVNATRISAVLRNKRIIELFPILARRRIKGMMPQAVRRYQELMNQDVNLEVSRKVSESVLRESKVLESPDVTIRNTIELLPNEKLLEIIGKVKDVSGAVIDAEIVSDDPPTQ